MRYVTSGFSPSNRRKKEQCEYNNSTCGKHSPAKDEIEMFES